MTNFISRFFKKDVDMTSGNLFTKIILFALPAMLTMMMQLLYVTIDLTTVHHGDSAESMGAISSNNALINLIVVVFTGTSIGANVLMSESKGANNPEKAEKLLHTSILFALISGIAVGVLGFIVSDDLLVMMGTGEHYLAKAALYLKIYFVGLPFLMLFNYSAQLLRGQGDSSTPFIALLISGLINVGFDCLFVFPLHMGVAGVGLATIIAEAISAFICIFKLIKSKNSFVSLHLKKLRIDKEALIELLKVGLPAGLQGFFFSLPNVFIQASLYTIDPGNINLENGANASSNIEGYFYSGVDSIATSVMTFIAANVGAKKKDNIIKVIKYGVIWELIAISIIVLLTFLLHRPLLSLFVDNEESINSGYTRLAVMGYLYCFDFTMNFSGAVLRGFKRSTYPMVTTLICCSALRILLIYTVFPLEMFHTLFWLYFLFPLTWILASIANIIALIIFMPKDLKKLEASEEVKPITAN